MSRRLLASLLVICLLPASAFAESLRAAAERAVLRIEGAAQVQPAGRNPYKTPALALMAGGGALLLIGLLQDRGAEVNTSGSSVSVTEKGGSKTTLTALGAAAGAGGAFLWFWGENKKKRIAPSVSVGRGALYASAQVRF